MATGVATVLWLLDSRYFSSGFTSWLWRAATHDGRKVSIFQKPSPLGRVSLIAQLVKNPPAMQETPVWFQGGGRSAGGGIGYPLQYSLASLVAQLVKYPTTMWETGFDPWVGEILWRRERLPTPVFWSGKFHGHKELDTTERLSLSLHFPLLVRNLTNIWEILRDQIVSHSAGRLIPDQVKIFEKPL